MKTLHRNLCILLAFAIHGSVVAQQETETIIRKLEQAEVQAILKGDTATLFNKLWAPEFVVNNPANQVVTKSEVAVLLRTGKIDYEHFDRLIEKVTIIGEIAIVMGREDVKPKGVTNHAGQVVTRRFTNIWMKQNGNWKAVGRQATIAAVN
jgi:ketosteroid isomerase-like protein